MWKVRGSGDFRGRTGCGRLSPSFPCARLPRAHGGELDGQSWPRAKGVLLGGRAWVLKGVLFRGGGGKVTGKWLVPSSVPGAPGCARPAESLVYRWGTRGRETELSGPPDAGRADVSPSASGKDSGQVVLSTWPPAESRRASRGSARGSRGRGGGAGGTGAGRTAARTESRSRGATAGGGVAWGESHLSRRGGVWREFMQNGKRRHPKLGGRGVA